MLIVMMGRIVPEMGTVVVSVFLVAPPHEGSDLSGHCGVCTVGWLVGCVLTQTQNFENFIRFQKFQNQNGI